MALIHCPDCEREVSSRAIACPQCAYPIQNLTNLYDAVRQNDVDMLRDLLRAGHKPNYVDDNGLTPLIVACRQGNYSATKLLVNAGAEVNHQDGDGTTPLMQAVVEGNGRIATLLIKKGADPSLKNVEGETALDLALSDENDDLAAILRSSLEQSEKNNPTEEKLAKTNRGDASVPPVLSESTASAPDGRDVRTTSTVEPQLPPIGPPPLPQEPVHPTPVKFLDDLAPVTDDEKYNGPGLICRTCQNQIAAEDIWCRECKAPIIRRYCGGCHELIPDNAARCPYCQSSKLHRFRYIRHLEQIVAGSAILGVLLFVLGVYNPNDGSSYAGKLAQKRSEQQEQNDISAEKTSKELKQQRMRGFDAAPKTRPAVIRVVPRETDRNDVINANGNVERTPQIPTVGRIEVAPSAEAADSRPQVGKPLEQPEPETSEITEKEDPKKSVDEPEGSPELARRLNEKGFRLMKNGRYADAIPVLAQAVRSFPSGQKNLTYAYALFNLGRSLRLAGRPDLAIPILEERMKFADQRHVVARELDQARAEINGPEQFDNVEFE